MFWWNYFCNNYKDVTQESVPRNYFAIILARMISFRSVQTALVRCKQTGLLPENKSMVFNNAQRGIKTNGFQNGKFWGISKLAILVHQQIWYTLGWFFGTQKGIKPDGFQNGKFWRLSKLAILVHQQFWYMFGCFQVLQTEITIRTTNCRLKSRCRKLFKVM